MEQHTQFATRNYRPETYGSLLRLGLWMRAAFVGAAVAVAGFASLIDPPDGVSFVTALPWIMCGATFAWLSWQRTVVLFDRVDREEPIRGELGVASPMQSAICMPGSYGRTAPRDRSGIERLMTPATEGRS